MPAAAPAKFSRAEFSAAVNGYKRKDSDWRVIAFSLVWVLGIGIMIARLSSKLEESPGWFQVIAAVALPLLMVGPIAAVHFYSQRKSRLFSKCPNCRGDVITGSSATCILATGRCGCCGYEVLKREGCWEAAITAVPPSVEFKKLSLEDFITKARTARRREAWRVATFTFLYLAGLSPFLWHLYTSAEPSVLSSRQFAALMVAWSCLSPILWTKVSRWLFGSNPFPSCPHCHASWPYPSDHMIVVATGRCGDCGVQVLEESGDAFLPSGPVSSGRHGNEAVPTHPPLETNLLSRSQFLAFHRAHKVVFEETKQTAKRWAIFWLGSTLAVLIASILFLQPRSLLFVTLGWYFASSMIADVVIKRKRSGKGGNPDGSDAPWKVCPSCKNRNEGSSDKLIITTGKCGKCLNVILQNDIGQEQKDIH